MLCPAFIATNSTERASSLIIGAAHGRSVWMRCGLDVIAGHSDQSDAQFLSGRFRCADNCSHFFLAFEISRTVPSSNLRSNDDRRRSTLKTRAKFPRCGLFREAAFSNAKFRLDRRNDVCGGDCGLILGRYSAPVTATQMPLVRRILVVLGRDSAGFSRPHDCRRSVRGYLAHKVGNFIAIKTHRKNGIATPLTRRLFHSVDRLLAAIHQ